MSKQVTIYMHIHTENDNKLAEGLNVSDRQPAQCNILKFLEF